MLITRIIVRIVLFDVDVVMGVVERTRNCDVENLLEREYTLYCLDCLV